MYDQSRRLGDWSVDLDWVDHRHQRLPHHLRDEAWNIASQSSYAEQLGMTTAAQLLLESPSYSLRLALSRAIADEARHSEVFSKYALAARGRIAKPAKDMEQVTDAFRKCKTFYERFTLHVTLESMALEEFRLFSALFKESLLGSLYLNANRDESRHVAMGIKYLRSALASGDVSLDKLTHATNTAAIQSALPDEDINYLCRLVGATRETVLRTFENRQSKLIDQILCVNEPL